MADTSSAARQGLYAFLAVAGAAATWYFNLQFMREHGGFTLAPFIAGMYANAASSSIGNDIVVVGLAFFGWSFFEARRLQMRHWWLYVALSLVVALAFAFPAFLLMRERHMVRNRAA